MRPEKSELNMIKVITQFGQTGNKINQVITMLKYLVTLYIYICVKICMW